MQPPLYTDPRLVRSTVLNSALALFDIMALFEELGLSVAATHLSLAMDAACENLGIEPAALDAALEQPAN